MAVQPQTPYKEYTANGSTKSFALEFDCDNQDHLIVLVDEVEPAVGTWSLSAGAVVFNTAPTSGKKITIQRNTPFRRDEDFQSYDNSFRPPGVNKGFDKIWLKLQELGVADWILSSRINDLRAYVDKQDNVLQDNIDSLKNYVDDKDDGLRNYLLNAIQEQGVALDQLEEYYSYLMQQLAQVAIDRGWAASFIVSADGSTQQEINDRIGNTWYTKPLGYELNARVMLENGDIVKSTVANNTVDPNVDMTGWVFKSQGGLSTVDLSLMWKKSSTVNVRDVLQTAINLTPDGGLLVIPFDIFIDGTVSVVNKNINIECYGKVFVKPNANGSVVFERTDFIEVPAASVLSAAPKKGDLKLSFSSVPVPNLNDYFVAVMSSEVAIKRITPLSDYNKNVTVDFISKDGYLRDPFIYTINDLSTTKLRFVKKSTPVKVSGLHLIPTLTPSVSVDYITRQYASNIHFDNVIVDLSNHESAGRAIALDWCYGLTHYKTGVIGANKDGVDSYAINNWQSSYCSFVECFYTDTAGNTKEARGYAARHGYHIVLDGCLFSGVDDHWGHDYIIKNMHMKRGVGITGGSVTIIDSTSTADLFYQRDDTPYNDGTLNIVRCRASNRLINSWRNAGDGVTPTKRKLFDFINIDAELVATQLTDSALLILDGNNVDDTFRDTILTINRLDFIVPDVSVRSPLIIRFAADTTFNSANMMNESLNTVKLFKKIHIKNVTQTLGNHTESSVLNSPFYGLCADEVVFENVDRCMFSNLRATKVKFLGGEFGLKGTANLGAYDSAEISVDRTYFNEFSQEFYHSNVNNPNPKIYTSDARFKMYSIAYEKLGFSKIEKSVGCIFDDYNTVQSVRGDYVNLSNYIKANIFTYIPSAAISVPANGVSSTITVAWNNLRGNDLVRGWVSEWNEDLEVETSISGLSNGTLRFKIRNKSSSALSVSANRKIFFKIL